MVYSSQLKSTHLRYMVNLHVPGGVVSGMVKLICYIVKI